MTPATQQLRSMLTLARRPIWREARFGLELAGLLSDPVYKRPRRAGAPASVMLIPGFMTGDVHLAVMERWLSESGHVTERAGIRLNVDCSAAAMERLQGRLEEFAARRRRRVVLLGQSRGGLFARALAVQRPDLVSCIVTLGSPHTDPMSVHPLLMLQGATIATAGSFGLPGVFHHSCRTGECCRDFRADLAAPFPRRTRFVSLYSRTDGLVDWRACLDPAAEAVEIDSTHCGMAVNSGTYRVLGEILNGRSRAGTAATALARAA